MPLWQSRHALQWRATLAVVLLIVLLVLRSSSMAVISWTGRHDAAAIGVLGALHADVYSLALQLNEAPGLDPHPALSRIGSRLEHPRLVAAVERAGRADLAQDYHTLRRHWERTLAPLLAKGDRAGVRREATLFGDRLTRLGAHLQAHSDDLKTLDIRLQIATLVVGIVIMVALLLGLRRRVVNPLNELLDATETFRSGNFGVRVTHQSADEFGHLAQGFNTMAGDIEASHRRLEQRMNDEMRNLTQANAALSLFCVSSGSIAHGETNAAEINDLLRQFQALLPGLELTLCLHPAGDAPSGSVISFKGDGNRLVCSHFDCAGCKHFDAPHQRVFPVRSQGQSLGELRAQFPQGRPPGEWETMLTQALAHLIGNALLLGRQREKDNFLLLHNERNTIARELHDSLAQSLSYLKLQVTRLQLLVERGENSEQVLAASRELGSGLNDAYAQLRELLTTFRLDLSDGDLMNALKVAVQEFSQRGGLRILLATDELTVPLAATEEIHLLQILREALSNCCRHAGADQVWVRLGQVGEEMELTVEDDGRGFAPASDGHEHHGIAIMNERARSIGGVLEVGPREPRGSRVRLRFRPRFLARDIKEMTV